jgi:hypothetical protein
MMNKPQGIRDIKSKKPTLRFYILWVLANGLGTIIGTIILIFLLVSFGMLSIPLPEQQSKLEGIWKMVTGISIVSIPFGGIIGIMQWLVIRKYIANSGFWFATSAIAMFTGYTVSSVIPIFYLGHQPSDLFISWFFFGAVSGALQWLILRRQINYSGLWIIVNIIAGGITGILLPDLGIIGGTIGWALCGILTGGTLFVLFQKTNRDYDSQSIA